jgi:hypothetical protein
MLAGIRSSSEIAMCSKPLWFTKTKLTKIQQSGLTYERKVVKHFKKLQKNEGWPGQLLFGQWFNYNGSYLCPDILLVTPSVVHIFEVKLTQTKMATAQLNGYEKCLKEFFHLPTTKTQIFRNLVDKKDLTTFPGILPNIINMWHLFL